MKNCSVLLTWLRHDATTAVLLQFDVKEAKIIENHPQWDLSEDEADKDNSDSGSLTDDSESDFEYLDDWARHNNLVQQLRCVNIQHSSAE